MTKIRNKGIRQKIFIITSIFLFLSSFAIYLTVYMLLPDYYNKYKKDKIASEMKSLIEKANKVELIDPSDSKEYTDNAPKINKDIEEYINNFARINNVTVIIANNTQILHATNAYVPVLFKEGMKYLPSEAEFPKVGIPSLDYNPKLYTVETKIYFKDIEGPLRLIVNSPLQPIDEAAAVILSLAPIILTIILGIAGIGSYFYTIYIANPIVKVNKTARKMAKLDFETKCVVNSNDEIGEISNSLNELSRNLKRAMEELERKNSELKSDIEKEREIEAKRREFVATISHELKSPIAAAKGQIEGMINNIGVFKDREKYLRKSYTTINSMEKLVKEILDMSKFEDYNFRPILKEVNLSKLIKKIIINEEFLRISKEIKLTTNIEDNVIVLLDENLILKAITNIINNALKYSPNKESIIISLKTIESKVEFKVINTGVSIDNKDIKEIFKAFYRVEKSRNRDTGGSGLGLYIVSSIFSSHNVEHNIKSENNKVIFTANFHL